MAMLLPFGAGAAESAAARPKAAASKAVAADFLEYLATLEGDDDNWTDFAAAAEQRPAKTSKAAAPQADKADEPK